MNAGGLVPSISAGRRRNFDGTAYEIRVVFLRLVLKVQIGMPWGGFGGQRWRPW